MKLLISPAKKMRAEDFLPPRTQTPLLEKSAQLLNYVRGLPLPPAEASAGLQREPGPGGFRNLPRHGAGPGHHPGAAGLRRHPVTSTWPPGVFTQAQLEYVGEHLRILSGFYGVLRPFDGVSPYRLEMQAKVKAPFCKKPLRLLGGLPGGVLLQEDSVLVNLASEEYAKAVRPAVAGKGRFVTCVFAEEPEPGRLVEKGVYVKMARGEMVRFAAEHNVQSPEGLQGFSRLGYAFDSQRSTEDTYLFCRSAPPKRLKNF